MNESAVQSGSLLRFRVGIVRGALDSAVVRRVVTLPGHLVRLERAGHRPGVFRDEGSLVSVIDLRSLLGQAVAGAMAPPVIIVEVGGRHYGLVVDAVERLVTARSGRSASLPRPLPPGVFRRTWLFDDELVLELDAAAVVRARPLPMGWHRPFFPEEEASSDTAPSLPSAAQRPGDAAGQAEHPEGERQKADDTGRAEGRKAVPEPVDSGSPAQRTDATRVEVSPVRHAATRSSRSGAGSRKDIRTARSRPRPEPPTRPKAANSLGNGSEHGARTTPLPRTVPTPPSPMPERPSAFEADLPDDEPLGHDDAPWPEERSVSPVLWLLAGVVLLAIGTLGWWLWPRPLPEPPRPAEAGMAFRLPAIDHPVRAPGRVLDEAWLPAAGEEQRIPPRAEAGPTVEAEAPLAGGEAEVLDEAPGVRLTRSGREVVLRIRAQMSDDESPVQADGAPATGPAEPAPPRSRFPGQARSSEEGAMAGRTEPDQASGNEAPGQGEVSQVLPEECAPRITERRMTHVVVRGDTLWDIAEHYLGNPWRYPELARLSRIRDPDLIYPGDRVVLVLEQVLPGCDP